MNPIVNGEILVPADHPALPGHFPGHPLVPGVVLLDAVRAAIPDSRQWLLQAIPAVKFLQPVRPGERVELRIELSREHSIVRARFQGRRDTVLVFEGTLQFADGSPA